MEALHKWCREFTGSSCPVACWASTDYADIIEIGDVQVWDSESGYADEGENFDDDPRADRCIIAYKTIIKSMSSWPDGLAGDAS